MVSTLSKAVLAGVACGALGVGLGGFWAFRDEPVRQEPMRTFIRPTGAEAPAALAAVHVERDLGALGIMLQAARRVVVAVERDVHQAKRPRHLQHQVQPLREPGTAGIKANHRGLGPDPGFEFSR